MIELTEQQREALVGSEPVIIDPQTHEEYVLVRRAIFERFRRFLEDESVLATGEIVDRLMAEDDTNDPYLETYQSISRECQP
jgi:hypothetical protein